VCVCVCMRASNANSRVRCLLPITALVAEFVAMRVAVCVAVCVVLCVVLCGAVSCTHPATCCWHNMIAAVCLARYSLCWECVLQCVL